MGWHGPYYYRSRRIGGRVVREYIGTGNVAGLVAQLDEIEREKKRCQAEDLKIQRDRARALEEPFERIDEVAELLGRAALAAAGYHQHKRGEWRRKRNGNDKCKKPAPPVGGPQAD
jgi:hypothetical protein